MEPPDASYWKRLPPTSETGEAYHVVIEIPRGEKVKYEYNEKLDVLYLDRVLYSSVHYPENYGFVPRTLADDGDPMDVLLLCQEPLLPLTVAEAVPIGGLEMEDEKGVDHKIIAVASKDPQYNGFASLDDLPEHKMREIRQFFAEYKELEQKDVAVHEFYGPEKAGKFLVKSIDTFLREFPELGQQESEL